MADIGLLFRQGTLAQLENAELIAGSINVTTDEPAIYIDVPNAEGTQTVRKRVGDLIIVPNEEALMTDTTGKTGVVNGALVGEWSTSALYYAEEEGALLKWNGESWKQLNALSDVDAAVGNLTQSVGNLQNALGETNTIVAGNTNKINNLTEKVGNIPESASATTVIGYVDEKVSEVDEKISTLSETVEDIDEQVAKNNTAIGENQASIAANSKVIGTLQELVAGHTEDIAANSAAITKEVQDRTAAVAAVDTKINNHIDAYNTTIGEIERAYAKADGETLQGAKDYTDSAIEARLQAADAMTFKGVLGTDTEAGQIADLPTGAVADGETMVNAGDTYKVSVEGEYGPDDTHAYIGDLFIALGDQMDQDEPNTYASGWAHVSSGYESDYNPHLTVIPAANEANGITLKLSGGADENLGTEDIIGSTNIKVSHDATKATTTFSLVWGSFES